MKSHTNQDEVLSRLQAWYLANCDGDWEHRYGIHIETLDNPGWLVKIDLVRTTQKRRAFVEIRENIGVSGHPTQSKWLHCAVKDGVWEGAADGKQLSRLLELFLDWVNDTGQLGKV